MIFLLAHFADDNTPHCSVSKISNVLINLENTVETLLQWFKDNRNKYYFHINNNKESFQIKIGNESITHSINPNFNEHVTSLCKKASQKLNALSRIAYSIAFDQKILILNCFITSFLLIYGCMDVP